MKTFDPRWRLGLERMYPLLTELGDPQAGLEIIQVAGTNGKGSVSYLTAGLLSAVGQSPVGLYTSPHLERLSERFQIIEKGSRREFPSEQVNRALERVAEAALTLPESLGELTEFEAWTLAAVLLYAEAGITKAVFEVGLGGRLDATTALPAELAIICPISFDHQDRLGNDLASIAGEKAAIIRPGQSVIVSEQETQALKVIEAKAIEQGAQVISIKTRYYPVEYAPGGTVFNWFSRSGLSYQFSLGLLGKQQVMNAACALSAVEELYGHEYLAQLDIIDRARCFLADSRWPGRFEILEVRGQTVVLDVGHNPQAVALFLENLELYFPNTDKWGIYATLRDKDYRTAVSLIGQHKFAGLVITEPWSDRGLSASELSSFFPPETRLVQEIDLERAVERGLELAGADEALLTVFGSFFVVGPARTRMLRGVAQ